MACRQGERCGTCGSPARIYCTLKKSQRKEFFSGVLRAASLKNYPSRSLVATFSFWASHKRDRLPRHRRIRTDIPFRGLGANPLPRRLGSLLPLLENQEGPDPGKGGWSLGVFEHSVLAICGVRERGRTARLSVH